MNRREMLLRTGAAAATFGLSQFPFGWTARADGSSKRVLMFTRSQGFEHSVVKRKNGALSLAAAYDSALPEERRRHLEALAADHRQLELWAVNCPENFENRVALVSAEIARIKGRVLDAEHLYEQAIRSANISFTILRPVVIYGEGEKGNFAIIHRLSRLPVPLPFGALTARRSILSIHNFNSAVETALSNPRARGETFIVSDPTPVTVSNLIARHRAGLGRRPNLIPMPESWIEAGLKAMGQASIWERIGRSLVAPPRKLLSIGWEPS